MLRISPFGGLPASGGFERVEKGLIHHRERKERKEEWDTDRPQITQINADYSSLKLSRVPLLKNPSKLVFSSNVTHSPDASHLPLRRLERGRRAISQSAQSKQRLSSKTSAKRRLSPREQGERRGSWETGKTSLLGFAVWQLPRWFWAVFTPP